MNRFNRRKGFANVVAVIAVMIVLAVGYAWWMQKSILDVQMAASTPTRPSGGGEVVPGGETFITRSGVYIYGPELNKVKVSLVSSDEKTDVVSSSYCGGKAGSKEYSGRYKLTLDPKTATSDNPGGHADLEWSYSEVDLGELSFVEGTPWDGNLIADTLDPKGYKNFVLLKQYATCNGFFLSVFGYDIETGKLMRFKFADDSVPLQDSLFVTTMGKSKNGNLLTSSYNNANGTAPDQEWALEPTTKIFHPLEFRD